MTEAKIDTGTDELLCVIRDRYRYLPRRDLPEAYRH
jgi:hypothetical protein